MIAPSFELVPSGGGTSTVLRYEPSSRRQVIVISSLFHEEPRLRRLCGDIMRGLAQRGIGSGMIDLPGCGESTGSLPRRLGEWRKSIGVAACAIGATHSLALRAGAILDDVVVPDCRWRFAPTTGAAIVRDLVRAAALERQEDRTIKRIQALAEQARTSECRLAGFKLPASLVTDLETANAEQGAGRTARLAGDARPADVRIAGAMLWRKVDPGGDLVLAQAIVDDFVSWSA